MIPPTSPFGQSPVLKQGNTIFNPLLNPLGQGVLRNQIPYGSQPINQYSQNTRGAAYITKSNVRVRGRPTANVRLNIPLQIPNIHGVELSSDTTFGDLSTASFQPQYFDLLGISASRKTAVFPFTFVPANKQSPVSSQQQQAFPMHQYFQPQVQYDGNEQQFQFAPYMSPIFIQALPQRPSHERKNAFSQQNGLIQFSEPTTVANQQFDPVPNSKFEPVRSQISQLKNYALKNSTPHRPNSALPGGEVLSPSNSLFYLNPYLGPVRVAS